jgi:uncharacterized protein with ParB-like and HNH nuclease domain
MFITCSTNRGTRRDFIDLYVVSQEHGLASLLDLFKKKCAQANYSLIHVLKSLTYFGEAERDPTPDLLIDVSWEDLKAFFIRRFLLFSESDDNASLKVRLRSPGRKL